MKQAVHSVGDLFGGRYEIRGIVGKRPLGIMFRAFDREVEIEVALRVIAPELLVDEASRDAFMQKMARARALSHPNLMRCHGIATDGESVAVAVQWAPGKTLREGLVQHEAGMSPSEARPILQQVAAGLQHAHTQGLVMGDVRPETVILYADGIKLSNVGIGLALPRRAFLEAMQGTRAHAYLAPELRAGRVAEPRADAFTLATLAIELLTGAAPQPGARPTLAALGNLPPALGPALSRALAEDPMLRQPTVEALGREIDSILATGAPRPRRNSQPPISEPEVTAPEARPRGFNENHEATRQVHEDELRQIQGREVTRQIHKDQLFPLLVQSSDEYELEMEAEFEEPDTFDGERDESDTERVHLLDAEAIRTAPVPRVDPPEAPEPPEAKTDVKPAPAPPKVEVQAAPIKVEPQDYDDEEDLETIRVEKLAPEELSRAANGVFASSPPPRPRPVAPPPQFAPPAPAPQRPSWPPPPRPPVPVPVAVAPAEPLPKIQVIELPVDAPMLPSRPRNPTPPRGVRPPTVEVQPRRRARPARRRNLVAGLMVIAAFAVVLGAVVLGIVDYMHDVRMARERSAKSQLADQLNARAEAMRRASTPGALAAAAPPGNGNGNGNANATTAPPVAAPPLPVLVPVAAPLGRGCPLGSNLMDGAHRYCVDVYEYPGGKTMPRTEVTFEQASRLCASRGERLCTEQEWERACRGKSGASYPYGQSFDPTRCNTRGSGSEIAPAGSFASCRSASGAYDMSGNVAEWVLGNHGPAQKGGSALSTNPQTRCSNAVHSPAKEGGIYVGFRCCSDPK